VSWRPISIRTESVSSTTRTFLAIGNPLVILRPTV
jgi:hypothetical protein